MSAGGKGTKQVVLPVPLVLRRLCDVGLAMETGSAGLGSIAIGRTSIWFDLAERRASCVAIARRVVLSSDCLAGGVDRFLIATISESMDGRGIGIGRLTGEVRMMVSLSIDTVRLLLESSAVDSLLPTLLDRRTCPLSLACVSDSSTLIPDEIARRGGDRTMTVSTSSNPGSCLTCTTSVLSPFAIRPPCSCSTTL